MDAISLAGLSPPPEIVIDGKIHRFNSGLKGRSGHGDKSGWYICFGDGVPSGRFGCWRAGIEMPFKANIGRPLQPDEELFFYKRMEEAKQQREIEEKIRHDAVSFVVSEIWDLASVANNDHPYLKKKSILPHGARVSGDGRLIVPIFDSEGVMLSVQYIGQDGDKKYHPGGQTSGGFYVIGNPTGSKRIFIAEGFATSATIHQVTGYPCVCSYSASNLVPVTEAIKAKFQGSEIVIVADNDQSGVGQRYAEQASARFGVDFIVPPIIGDANDYHLGGFDLSLLLNQPKDKWIISADEFSAKPLPISWLVKGWVPKGSLIMIHGPSGSGKTFVVLDMALTIASNAQTWAGSIKAKNGCVLYLAGEGHQGLRARVAAWKQEKRCESLNMFLSKSGCDLNTREGFSKVVSSIKASEICPSLIIVDTLHRFLLGDENSAQDAKGMLDSCAKLINEFRDCSVVLVHHTGVSAEAKGRARGSSAWRAALDVEISISQDDDKKIEVRQMKNKDFELSGDLYFSLDSVLINGWIDEDGENVYSAIINTLDKKEVETISKHGQLKRRFERSWIESGAEFLDDSPYISRSALVEFLVNNDGFKESTAEKMCNPSSDFIGDLINAGLIKHQRNGWIVTCKQWIFTMTLASRQKD